MSTDPATTAAHIPVPAPLALRERPGRWLDGYRPEDPAFWEGTGRPIARTNLRWSIFAEFLGFAVWQLWAITVIYLPAAGFAFSDSQIFWLISIPSLVGATLRIPYTFMVGRFGGRNWTIVSALLLLVTVEDIRAQKAILIAQSALRRLLEGLHERGHRRGARGSRLYSSRIAHYNPPHMPMQWNPVKKPIENNIAYPSWAFISPTKPGIMLLPQYVTPPTNSTKNKKISPFRTFWLEDFMDELSS